eukprot:4702225-Ditylum_brightwellii.AAC.1
MVRSGTAANATGPYLFLGHGKQMQNKSLSECKLVERHGAPHGSKFWLNKSGYMTDKDWLIATEQLCKGLRSLPVVRDHPVWWFMLTCDGLSLHVNTPDALHLFEEHKIMSVKEEGNSSHFAQSYDQQPAKCDKLEI